MLVRSSFFLMLLISWFYLGFFSLCFFVACVIVFILITSFSPIALPFRELPKGKPRRGILNGRYSKSRIQKSEPFDVIVIGSGMGGLSCAATLSRFGKKVLVLEQHDVAGGGTHEFVIDGKKDYNFDSGLHYTIPRSGELLQLACGTKKKPVVFDKLGEDDGCFDKIVFGDIQQDGFRIKHKQEHLDTLRKIFSDQKDRKELDAFLKLANKINNLIPLWIISKGLPRWGRIICKKIFLGPFSYWCSKTGEEVTKSIISNPKLASILNGLWIDSGSPPNCSSFMMTAALSVGFPKEGGAYPRGGTRLMATCLIQAIEISGGKVLCRAKVDEILVDSASNKTMGVRMIDNTNIYAPIVVSACGYANTYLKLLPSTVVPNNYATKDSITNKRKLPTHLADSMGFIMANIGINASAKELGIGCSNIWIQPCSEENGWDMFHGIREYLKNPLLIKQIPMMITFPSIKDRSYDDKNDRITCQILALCKQEWFDKWDSENGNHPKGGKYEQRKKKWEDKLVSSLLARYPVMKGKIDFVDLATPLSIKYYLNKSRGGAVGLDSNPERFYNQEIEDLLDMKSPFDGLWLTGEDTLLCGQPLAQISGIMTACRISGFASSMSFLFWIVRLAIGDLVGI